MERSKKGISSSKNFNLTVSIIIAIFLWVYVVSEINPLTQQTMAEIPVQLLNAQTITDRNLAISGENKYTISVVLEGKRADVVKVTADDIIANADLFGFGKGENYLSVTVSVPNGIKIKEISPSKIKVLIEPMISEDKNVIVSYSGEIKDGQEPGRITLSPMSLSVKGPESAVKNVDHINVTSNISDLTAEPKSFDFRATPMDIAGKVIENVTLSSETIKATIQMLEVKSVSLVPSYTGTLDAQYDIGSLVIPATIKIKGTKAELAQLGSIQMSPVNLAKLTPKANQLIKPILPVGIELAKGSEALYAEISAASLTSSQLFYNADEIAIVGLDSKLKALISTPSIMITVTGKADIINALQKADVSPYIDITGAIVSNDKHPVLLRSTKTLDKTNIEPIMVDVVISEK